MRARADLVSYEDAVNLLRSSRASMVASFGERAQTGTVTLYRGYSSQGRTVAYKLGEEVPMDLNPLSSWTTDKFESANFGDVTFAMDVPLHDIAGIAGTGLGGGSMSEVVVFARPGQVARVIRTGGHME
jgi:hypothetical protein